MQKHQLLAIIQTNSNGKAILLFGWVEVEEGLVNVAVSFVATYPIFDAVALMGRAEQKLAFAENHVVSRLAIVI